MRKAHTQNYVRHLLKPILLLSVTYRVYHLKVRRFPSGNLHNVHQKDPCYSVTVECVTDCQVSDYLFA